MYFEINSEQKIQNIWKNKHILILADQFFKDLANSLIRSDAFSLLSYDILHCKDEYFIIEKRLIKITIFSTFFIKQFLKKLGISDSQYDVILYLGENKRMLKLIEKWCKDKDFVYIGSESTYRPSIQFVPDGQSENSAYSFVNLLNKLSL